MAAVAITERLNESWPHALARSLNGCFCRAEDIDDVHSIDDIRGDIETLGALKVMGCGEGGPFRGSVRVEIVFNHDQQGQLEEAGHIQGFGKCPMIGRTL